MNMLGRKSSLYKAVLLILGSLLMGNVRLQAQEHAMDSAKTKRSHVLLMPSQLVWGPGPAGLPGGAKLAVVSGDPSKEGLFTIRLWFPANYVIPAHWHPTDEHVTVLKGMIAMGMGDKLDNRKFKSIPAGGYALLPAKMSHFAMAQEESVIQLVAMGPFAITYVNAAHDPRNK